MAKPTLLFLAHRIPYPPNKGDKIRSFNLLKALSKDYEINLGTFVDDPSDWKYRQDLGEYCGDTFILELKRARKYTALQGLVRNEALSLPYYKFSKMQQWVDRKISENSISRVFVYSSAMAQYVAGEKYQALHRIIDFVDVDSEKWREYGQRCRFPMNLIYRREAKHLLEFDRRIAQEFDVSFFVSREESVLFKRLLGECTAQVDYLNNGVDYHYFDPALEYDAVYPAEQKTIVFTGAMDYWANVDAVTWFAKEILPLIRQREPETHFYVVGARPSEAVRKIASECVHIVGAVKDIRPYIATAACVVAPMRIARGVQNKVLEALALRVPIVATPAAMEGIEPPSGMAVDEDEGQIADRAVRYLRGQCSVELLGRGRERILRDFNWERNLEKLEACYGDRIDSAAPKFT